MAVVRWLNERGINAASKIESSEDATMYVLGMSEKQLKGRWRGKLVVEDVDEKNLSRRDKSKKKVVVELFNMFNSTTVMIKIFDRPSREGNKLVHIHFNDDPGETWMLSPEDLAEMNLAIAEGIQVYRQPDAWIELNKRKEVSGWSEDIKFQDSYSKQNNLTFNQKKCLSCYCRYSVMVAPGVYSPVSPDQRVVQVRVLLPVPCSCSSKVERDLGKVETTDRYRSGAPILKVVAMKNKFFFGKVNGVNADLKRHSETEQEIREELAKYEAEGNEQNVRIYKYFLDQLLASKAEVASQIGKKKGPQLRDLKRPTHNRRIVGLNPTGPTNLGE